MVSLDVIIMFRSPIFPVKRLIIMITNGANEKMRFQRYAIVGQHIFGPKIWFIPLKSNYIMVPLDVIIIFGSPIFPAKRLIFMITNGANGKNEFSKVCYRGATYFWA